MNFFKNIKKIIHPNRMANNLDSNRFPESLQFDDNTTNGFYFNGIYIPEEILSLILSYVDDDILKYSLVCKSWYNIIKSFSFWAQKYEKRYGKKAKKLPWHLYYSLMYTNFFDTNLLKNTCGENGYKQWVIVKNYGDEFRIEKPPCGADALPNSNDFYGNKSCFATSYYECSKKQTITLINRPIHSVILNTYKPEIYVSEWVAGRFDCGCTYTMTCTLCDKLDEVIDEKEAKFTVEQWMGKAWTKVQLYIIIYDNKSLFKKLIYLQVSISFKDYKEGVNTIIFQHEGQDTQFWKGHYGSKMSGSVVKILFDSINPIEQ